MGDIYHYDEESGKGVVYGSSVPIDDTKASEDTVYSSAKVETMMEEVQDELGELLYTETISFDKVTINANSNYQYDTRNVAKTGYTFLGIVGVYSGSNAGAIPFLWRKDGTNSVQFAIRNTTGSNLTLNGNPTLSLLYCKG